MGCRPHCPPKVMEQPDSLKLPQEIRRYLSDLPAETRLELEDHLLEEYFHHLRHGATRQQAAALTTERFGDLESMVPACAAVRPSEWWLRHGTSIDFKITVAGRMALSVFMSSRICVAPDPSHTSIITCLLTGIAFAGLGVGFLRRSPSVMWIASAFALGIMAIALVVPLQDSIASFLVSGCALEPLLLEGIAVFSVLSVATAWKELRDQRRLILTRAGLNGRSYE